MKPMQSMFRSSARDKGVPSLNMASMPDLIFTVLFFFMIVTHMRSDEVKVRLQVPQASRCLRPRRFRNLLTVPPSSMST